MLHGFLFVLAKSNALVQHVCIAAIWKFFDVLRDCIAMAEMELKTTEMVRKSRRVSQDFSRLDDYLPLPMWHRLQKASGDIFNRCFTVTEVS